MEAKCSYCEFFGDKPHCHNCKIFNGSRTYVQTEIKLTLDEIIDHINNNENVEAFNIGDYKNITLYTGETAKLIVLDFNKDTLASDGSSTAKVTFGILKNDGYFKMNEQNTNAGGWESSMMRLRMDKFYSILPPILKDNIKPVFKKTARSGTDGEIVQTVDNLFLFSEIEFYGRNKYSHVGEGEQYEYFTQKDNRALENYPWLRSPCRGGTHHFCYVYGAVDSSFNLADGSCGVAFGFCI
ncbi:MAG: DUF6273 domain-containing protein [Christensenellaceae bacterium]